MAVTETERRKETRSNELVPALVRAWDRSMQDRRLGLLEEESEGGLRLRTFGRVHPDEALVLYVAGKPKPIRARVMWVREEGKACVAGCRFETPTQPARTLPDWLGPAILVATFAAIASLILYAFFFGSQIAA